MHYTHPFPQSLFTYFRDLMGAEGVTNPSDSTKAPRAGTKRSDKIADVCRYVFFVPDALIASTVRVIQVPHLRAMVYEFLPPWTFRWIGKNDARGKSPYVS
jgi:hypothetical protein